MVTTHLIFFGFFEGAEPTAASAGYGTSQPPIGFFAFNDGATPSDVIDEPAGLSGGVGGGGGVANWPGRAERSWDKWWKKEHAKRLKKQKEAAEKKVEQLQKKVKEARGDLEEARDLEAIQGLYRLLDRIQKRLDKEQAILDDLEMQEVALVWALWNQ